MILKAEMAHDRPLIGSDHQLSHHSCASGEEIYCLGLDVCQSHFLGRIRKGTLRT